MKIKLAVTGAAIAALALAGCSSDSDEETEASPSPSAEETMDTEAGTIVDVAAGTEGFETLVTAVGAADLTETLNGEGPFTVFAPTDEAFAAVDQATLDLLLLPSNQEALADVLTYHVVPDEILSSDIPEGETMVASVETSELTVVNEGGTVTVNGANVTTADVMASNGVIHVIDAVLLPPDFDPASLATE
jgi:uncharacterized surface protein with fasciclin (FAS1) repeats